MLKISNKSKKILISYGISLQVCIVPVLGQIHSTQLLLLETISCYEPEKIRDFQ